MEPPRQNKKQYLPRYSSTRRAELLKELCGPRNYSKEMVVANFTSFFADNKHRILLCALPKTGTSSWKYFLMRFASGDDHMKVNISMHNDRNIRKHGILPIRHGRLRHEYFSYYKILQVRHPFTRLISAYKDKVFGHPAGDYRLCKLLVEGLVPTWVQFAESVANRNSSCMNRHWMPYVEVCPVCDMEFDAVIKLETISTDIDDFFKSAGEPGKTTEDYMNELPEDVLSKLKIMFKSDMELFGYEIDSDRRLSCRYEVHDEDGRERRC
ncbi:hypothetical protein CAPTEDRAFT_199624 [Capitella teleta]|uniref:Carbohydrate sulfotransferase n=1 Tax=Capitella teleta TaxID=283909 RepID=R7UHA1_CAPTE|nr:hypothetical protein CAPTEDRAFT_199624 [Capitella teleta]|eukprot:ELU02652.1 hypothetical protein CAPTEDRAFT_199624 [Capitella teleta]